MDEIEPPRYYCWKCSEVYGMPVYNEGSEVYSTTLANGEEVEICALFEVIL